MRILKIGTFNKQGHPTGWALDGTDCETGEYCLGLDVGGPGKVSVNGIEIVEWTEARKAAMNAHRSA